MMPVVPDTLIWMWAGAIALCVVALGVAVYFHFRKSSPPLTATIESFPGFFAATATQFPLLPLKWRMLGLTLITALLTVSIFYLAHHQIGVLVFKQVLITQGAVLGYLVDRGAFPYSRPHEFTPDVRWRYECRRALIIVAAMWVSAWGA